MKFNKKIIIVSLSLIGAVVLLGFIFGKTDLKRIMENKKPIFTFFSDQLKDNTATKMYYGLCYKITERNINIDFETGNVLHKGYEFRFIFWQINTSVFNDFINLNSYELVDETEICADALEELYRSEDKVYYLPCIKSENIFLKYGNGTKIAIRDALENNTVTIDELTEKGLEVYSSDVENDSSKEIITTEPTSTTTKKVEHDSNTTKATTKSVSTTTSTTTKQTTTKSGSGVPFFSWWITDFKIGTNCTSKTNCASECHSAGNKWDGYTHICTEVYDKTYEFMGYMLNIYDGTSDPIDWR